MEIVRTEVEQKEPFKSFKLTFSIESKEEAQAMYALFNYSENAALFKGDISADIKSAIGNYYTYDKIANGITYHEFYRPKEAMGGRL